MTKRFLYQKLKHCGFLKDLCFEQSFDYRLDQELSASISEERTLKERIESLEANLAEVEECHAHKELKSAATLQQQSKLITYLQSKLEEQGRRKKTLTDKLFGRKDKENTSNNIMTP